MCEMFTFLSRYARASCLQRLQIFIFGTKTQRRKLRRARVYSAAAATAAATAAAVPPLANYPGSSLSCVQNDSSIITVSLRVTHIIPWNLALNYRLLIISQH